MSEAGQGVEDRQGYTWAEIREMMQSYAEQDARGDRPAFLPADAVKVDGEWRWEDEKLAWWWRPGEIFAHAWSKEIYVSSRIEKDEWASYPYTGNPTSGATIPSRPIVG